MPAGHPLQAKGFEVSEVSGCQMLLQVHPSVSVVQTGRGSSQGLLTLGFKF